MKTLLLLLAIIPIVTMAQPKKFVSTKPPLIQSITSDTSNGKYNVVLFTYDEKKRVIAIINKEIIIQKEATQKNNLVENIIKEQIFQYADTGLQPYSRKTTSHVPVYNATQNNDIFIIESIEQLYFLYKNGERIGDSAIYVKNWQKEEDWDWKTAEPEIRRGELKKTDKRIYHAIDLTKPYSPPTIFSNEFKRNAQLNISNDVSSYRWGNNANEATYYTFSAFDTQLNPLKQLNVANTLVNEKVSSEFGGQYGKTDINWYFVNQNNYTNYTVTTNEQSQHYQYIFKFSYMYNQFKQPIRAKVQVKQQYNKGGKLARTYTQGFTFRYN